ncbi:MAG: formate dehydrogenase accessory sulfurtransferase FdhD [Methanomicrobiales archaeon]|nr:formate dehydrogenase accessory sulfurtransferase FdhD [Methanomicrobiales archaeon]
MYKVVRCTREKSGTFTKSEHELVLEIPLTVTVNGRHALTVMTSPVMVRELVVGLLYTERIIHGPDEIESIQIEPDRVSVLTKNPFKILVSKKTVLSGCGGSSSFLDVAKLPKITSDLEIDVEDIRAGMKQTLQSDLHTKTGGTHIVGLFNADGVVCIAEDIGRHNALDRIIGYGLLNKVVFSKTFVASSGRVSSEMARKCLIAGIPVIVSRTATTSLAVEMADKTGLTIIGFARGDQMNIYTHPGRIRGAGTTG